MERNVLYFAVLVIMLLLAIVMTIIIYRKREKELSRKLEDANDKISEFRKLLKLRGSRNGLTDEATLNLAREIVRIENDLNGLGRDLPGSKYLREYVDEMKKTLKEHGYEIINPIGSPYSDRFNGTVVFLADDVAKEECVVTTVQKPQVNYWGKMIQSAHVTVDKRLCY